MKKIGLIVVFLIATISLLDATGVLTYIYKPANPKSELTSIYIDTDGSLKSTDASYTYLYNALNLTNRKFTALDSTPSIVDGAYFTMPSATGTFLTNLDDGYHGQIVYIMGSNTKGYVSFTASSFRGSANNIGLDTNDVLTFIFNDNDDLWRLTSFINASASNTF